MTPTPTPPMDERRLAEIREAIARVKYGGRPPMAVELLAEVDRLREAGARETRAVPFGALQVRLSPYLVRGYLFAHPDTLQAPDAQEIVDHFNDSLAGLRAARTPSPGDRAP